VENLASLRSSASIQPELIDDLDPGIGPQRPPYSALLSIACCHAANPPEIDMRSYRWGSGRGGSLVVDPIAAFHAPTSCVIISGGSIKRWLMAWPFKVHST